MTVGIGFFVAKTIRIGNYMIYVQGLAEMSRNDGPCAQGAGEQMIAWAI